MKYFLLPGLALLLSLPAYAQAVPNLAAQQHGGSRTPLVIQTCTNGAFSTSVTCTLTPHSTSNLLVAAGWISSTKTLNTPTGCGTWTVQASTATSNSRIWATASPTTTNSCTVTMTEGGTTDNVSIVVWEASNIIATVDGTPGFANGFQSSTFSGPSTITTSSNDVVFVAAFTNSANTINAQAPFTADSEGLADGLYLSAAHQLLATASTVSCSYAVQSGGQTYVTMIMALEP